MAGIPDLREFVRDEGVPAGRTAIVRGGPDTTAKLTTHAKRLQRAYVLDGAPVLGVSAFAALDDVGPASFDGICGGKLSSYRVVHVALLSKFEEAGFRLLPTFSRPHITLVIDNLDRIEALLDVLGCPRPNPQYGERTRHRRRRHR